jgi:hypothetical protein
MPTFARRPDRRHPDGKLDMNRAPIVRFVSSLAAMLLILAPSLAAAEAESGPAAGREVAALKVFVATGDDAGKEIDVAAARGAKPTVYIFVAADKWDRPLARFIKTLDEELTRSKSEARVFAVWLTDDVEKSKEYLPRAQQSIKLEQSALAVYPGEVGGPEGWSINDSVHLTAVVAHGGKVTASFGYRSVNETDVPAVLEKIEK